MLSTALSLDTDDAGARTAQWRQLVDLIVQAKGNVSASTRDIALARVAALRAAVPIEQRRLAATQLASRVADRDGVAMFGSDEPTVAAPILSVAQIDGSDWERVIPQMPPASRALLRNRRDLPEPAVRALASYGLSDFALPSNDDGGVTDAGTQIRDLVARIEAFRRGAAAVLPSPTGVPDAASDFLFETSSNGLFDWVSGAPREALIGISIADIADAGGYGVDGQAAGAFRRRAPFRDARLSVAGSGAAGGVWLMSATPVFNTRDGRFAGYNGFARRPRPDEIAGPAVHFAGTTVPVDSLHQLTHELRTPLNAILGFAEMIDRQLLGPAALSYREQARAIVQDGQRLLELVDDLDQGARVRRDAAAIDPDHILDAVTVLRRIEMRLQATLIVRDLQLAVMAPHPVSVAGVAPAMLERTMARLIDAALGLAQAGERLTVSLSQAINGQAMLTVGRPHALSGVSDMMLRDPGYDPEMPYPDAPLLGLGFTLRLIDSLARDVGGRLIIRADAFVLTLPGLPHRADLPAGTPSG